MTEVRPRRRVVALAVVISCLLPLIVLEIILGFLPVNEGLRTQPVNDGSPVLHFEPDRTSTWSRGWNFAQINTVHTNNVGFVSGVDYVTDDPRPLLALIGDSYVEAAMVPWVDTAAGRLATRWSDAARVYSFGASGSALSQYLAYARHVRDQYRPDVLVVLIIGNDFDESLLKYKDWPGQTFFTTGPSGQLETVRRDFEPSLLRRTVQHSKLAMYLISNVGLSGVQRLWQSWRHSAGTAEATFIGNSAASANDERLMDSRAAVDAFLQQIPSAAGLPPSRIIIAMEADRQLIYGMIDAKTSASSYFGRMRSYLVSEAGKAGFVTLDLQDAFSTDWQTHGNRFEWPEDWHWNAHGHALFARELMQLPVLADVLGTAVL